MYVAVDLICIGWFELWAMRRKRELQNEKFLPTTGVEPYYTGALTYCAIMSFWLQTFKDELNPSYYVYTLDVPRGDQII